MTAPVPIAGAACGIAALWLAARGGGWIFGRLTLPRVIGEILGGLLLGPTVLGAARPAARDWLFGADATSHLLSWLSWSGLVLLLFVSGFEIKGGFSRDDRRIAGIILAAATTLPFLAGAAAPLVFDFSPYMGARSNMPALVLVIGIAVAVTSIPVISRIFLDLSILHTRFARLVLAIAGVEDVGLWVALAVATSLVGSAAPSIRTLVVTPAVTLAFCAVGLLLVPRLLLGIVSGPASRILRAAPLLVIVVAALAAGMVADLVGVNVIFGAFLAGMAVGRLPGPEFDAARNRLRGVGVHLLIPLYFAIVGLRLDLRHHFDAAFFVWFCLFCTVVKAGATLLAGRVALSDWRSSLNLAMALNARGGPGIVLASVAFELGIINETFFVTLVLIAIVTSLLAGWWFAVVTARGWPLLCEPPSTGPVPRSAPARPRTAAG